MNANSSLPTPRGYILRRWPQILIGAAALGAALLIGRSTTTEWLHLEWTRGSVLAAALVLGGIIALRLQYAWARTTAARAILVYAPLIGLALFGSTSWAVAWTMQGAAVRPAADLSDIRTAYDLCPGSEVTLLNQRVGAFIRRDVEIARLLLDDAAAPDPTNVAATPGPPQPAHSPGQPNLGLPTPDEVRTGAKCTVEGRVLDNKTGRPLGKSQITLSAGNGHGGGPYSALTNSAGVFKLTGVSPGVYYSLVSRDGFAPSRDGAKTPGGHTAALVLRAGQTARDLLFRLAPLGSISGRVVNEDGRPLANAKLQAGYYAYSNGIPRVEWKATARTDLLGDYRLDSLAGRHYLVRAERAPEGVPILTYAPLYHPSVAHPGKAALIRVHAGEERRNVDLRLLPVRPVTLRGRVLGAAAGARVDVSVVYSGERAQMDDSFWCVPDETGAFQVVNLIPGAYMVRATQYRNGVRFSAHHAVTLAGEDEQEVALQLKPTVEVKGRVAVESGPAPHLNTAVWLRHTDPSLERRTGSPIVVAEANGAFRLKNIDPGKYRFEMSSVPWGFYVKAVTWRSANVIERGLTVGPDGVDGLAVVLSPNGGKAEGVVRDSEGNLVRDAKVLLIPEGKRRDSYLYHEGGTDDEGRYRFSGIAPGVYRLYAWLHIEWGDWYDPTLLDTYKDRSKQITVTPDSQVSVDPPLIRIAP